MKLVHTFFLISSILIFLLFYVTCVIPSQPYFSASFLDSNVQVIGTGVEGMPMQLFIKAQGTAPILYQWYKDDTTISNATSDTLSITCLSIDDQGIYKCRVSNSWGEATSSGYSLFVKTPPSIVLIPNQTICKGGTFSAIRLDNFVIDNDHTLDEISWTSSSYQNIIVSISANRIVTIDVADPTWIGTEKGQFKATDPNDLNDSIEVSFTVSDGNPPILSVIPDQAIMKGESFTTILLDHYVEDADNTDDEIIWNTSATTNLTVTINSDREALITVNDTTWIGSETVYFTAMDPVGLNNTVVVTFKVNIGNVPVVSDIPDQIIGKGGIFTDISLDNYVEDLDNADDELRWTTNTPTNLTIIINSDRLASIAVIDSNWIGNELIKFTVTDPDGQSDTNYASFTVREGTVPPVISTIQNQTIKKGEQFSIINLDEIVHDSDNHDSTILWTTYTSTNLTVSINTNRQATIGVKDPNWLGTDTIVFIAADPGGLTDSGSATFTVTDNCPPMVLDIPNDTILEGSNFTVINLDDFVHDSDNTDDQITWTVSPTTNIKVTISNDRKANITVLDPEWNGNETVTFTATDPTNLTNSDNALFKVNPVNDAPLVTKIVDETVKEGEAFSNIPLNNFVEDIDNSDDEITWSTSSTTNIGISISASNVATIAVKDPEWNGSETVVFIATDPGGLDDTCHTTFTVTSEADPPIVSDIGNQTIAEGDSFTSINLDDFVSDADNTDDQITWTTSPTTNITVSINSNRIATITILDEEWNGNETVTFTATDPTNLTNNDNATFTVTPVNDAPVITSIAPITATEDILFTYDPTAEDKEGDLLTWSLIKNPNGMTINSNTGSISWLPGESVLSADVTVQVTDNGNPPMSSEQNFTINVTPTYTVTYIGNGATSGTVPSDPNVYVSGSTVTVLANSGNLSNTGHTFSGWNVEANGNGAQYSPGENFTIGAEDIYLYAQWDLNQYTVRFLQGTNGTLSGELTQNVNHGNNCTPVTAEPVSIAYYFDRWTGDHVGDENPLTVTNVTNDMTIQANFAYDPQLKILEDLPAYVEKNVGDYFSTTIVADGGEKPYTYKWTIYGHPWPTQTTATLTFNNVAHNNQGNYRCRVVDNAGASVLTTVLEFRVINKPPVLHTTIPKQTCGAGAALSVKASDFFNDPDNDKLTYSYIEEGSHNWTILGFDEETGQLDLLDRTGTSSSMGRFSFTADDGHGGVTKSNIFTATHF